MTRLLSRAWRQVKQWLGPYDLEPMVVNGRPVYARRHFADGLLWYARSEADEHYWFIGAREDLGRARGWVSATTALS